MINARIARAVAAGAVLSSLAFTGHAEVAQSDASKAVVRSGNHRGFGRVAINTGGKIEYQLDQDGDHVVLRLSGDVTLGIAPTPPRNVLAMQTKGSSLELTLDHNATVRTGRMSGLVFLDILDPKKGAAAPQSLRRSREPVQLSTVASSAAASPPEPNGKALAVSAAPGVAAPASPVAVAAQPLPMPPAKPVAAAAHPLPKAASATEPTAREATQQTPPGRDVLPENEAPAGLMARRVKLPDDMDGSAFRVPFDSATGAAAFRRDDTAYIIFAERRPVDMSALRGDPVFGAATVQLLPNGTLFRVPLPHARWVALTPLQRGWRIAVLTKALKQQPIADTYQDGQLRLAAEQPSDIVSLVDPDTGATLLAGTQRRPGQGVAAARRSSEFILQPTIQGVVVEPLSDLITLRQTSTGFSLAGGAGGLLLSPPTSISDALMDAAHLTRRLDFSTLPPDVLLRLATKQIAAAAAVPPLARGLKNRQAAESLVALGFGAEAEGLLQVAAEQDPKEAASAETGAFSAIAALLAGREQEADALLDPRLDGADDIALWRAIRQAMQDDGSPGAAAVFSATAPLVFRYPKSIRDHILPLMIETMIKGGEIAPAARLLDQQKTDPKLAYARALMRQTEGDTDQALSLLDALAKGRDQFDRARAASRAVELRLATGKLNKVQAADALDKLLYAWRGDAKELALRERVAELRGQTGAWRDALAILRQAAIDFPEQAKPVRARLKDMFTKMIRDPGQQQVSPIDFVAMVDDNADLLPELDDNGGEVRQLLANRLLALDLPGRAKPVLEKLMVSAKSDVAKAEIGLSLATVESREGDDAGAQAALDRSAAQDLPPDLTEQRTILRATSAAHLGHPAAAVAMLSPLHTSRALQARAQILETALDWSAAQQAWSDDVAMTVPDSGVLDDGQKQTMLRFATATARAGDNAGLIGMRAKYGNRMGTGPLADMFRLLTAEPIKTSADIKRSQQEVNLAASLPSDLKALQTAGSGR